MEVIIVIPQTFKKFSENPNMMSYDRLLSLLHRHDTPADELVGRRLIAGQGLDDMQVDHAWYVGTSRGLINEFAHWRAARKERYADRALCHKHRPENILISVPEQQVDGAYTADLLLHERNELMLDHLTGQHIQGMVLTEACRQMFLAVTERYCLDDHPAVKHYFVINSMNARYQAFAFPLPAQIQYRVIDQQQPKPERISIHADMDVLQAGQVVAGMAPGAWSGQKSIACSGRASAVSSKLMCSRRPTLGISRFARNLGTLSSRRWLLCDSISKRARSRSSYPAPASIF